MNIDSVIKSKKAKFPPTIPFGLFEFVVSKNTGIDPLSRSAVVVYTFPFRRAPGDRCIKADVIIMFDIDNFTVV